MMRRRNAVQFVIGSLGATLALGLIGCEEPRVVHPESLEAPVNMTAVDGAVCLPVVIAEDATIGTSPLPRCDDDGNGFGLVVNQRSNSVSVISLGEREPRLANLDSRQPGITHIEVGERPVGVTTTGQGTAAVVANQGDQTLTGIDLWTLRPLADPLEIEGAPRAVESMLDAEGDSVLLALTSNPNRLEMMGGLVCERPDDDVDRRDHLADENCEWLEREPQGIDLPGRPVDMAVDTAAGRAWIIYRDLTVLSWVALDETGLGEDDECIEGGTETPCEIDRIAWQESDQADNESTQWGATKVDADPLGLFVYVMDRPSNQLFAFDRHRRTLIDASQATEPAMAPFRRSPGIPMSRSAMAMSADVTRQVLSESAPGHVRYRLGARVAANNGQLYRVGVTDIDCVFDGDVELSTSDFIFDDELRMASAEAECLFIPAFPLGGGPNFEEDSDLLDRRVVESNGATVAVTPVFGLRDSNDRQGQIVGRAQCDQPQELLESMRAVAGDNTVMGCGSPLSPQPVAPDVGEISNYADASRADLMTFARTRLDDAGQPSIERSVYDLRLVNEEWNVTYEGILPEPGTTGRGLVSREDDGVFLSGGAEFCSAGVEVGDRLTIRSNPANRSECDVFEGGSRYLTYEIIETGPFEVELGVLDEENRVSVLPTRECFDRGLNYEIRPHDQWTVVGQRSGMSSPWERDGDACVLRDDAATGLLEGRVETGEEYWGPYLNFQIREGEVDPVRDLRYTFRVERNFSIASEGILPENGTTMPSQVLFTPDLGAGRWVTVVDAGGDRIYLRNRSVSGEAGQFVR